MELGSGSSSRSSRSGSTAGWMDTMRITCLLNEDFSVTAFGGRMVLALANLHDPRQDWLVHYAATSTKLIKDKDAQPAFALVNRATKLALQFPGAKGFPMPLVPFDPASPDKSVLWTLSKDARHGFRRLRWLGDTNLFLTSIHENVRDGTVLVLWPHNARADHNQHWKIEPYEPDNMLDDLKAYYPVTSRAMVQVVQPQRVFKICCSSKPDYSLTADEDTDAVFLARGNSRSDCQKWIKDERYGRHVKDQHGYGAFALVNKATGKAIKRGLGIGHVVRQGAFSLYYLDESLLWRESSGRGFREIWVHNDPSALLHAHHADNPYFADWALVGLSTRGAGNGNQLWNIQEL